jgi:HEAT repeat protein
MLAAILCMAGGGIICRASETNLSHHDATVARLVADLASPDAELRTSAAENLGFLRAYDAADSLAAATMDDTVETRREACLSLAWCGGRAHVPALLTALDDHDWSVRQAAWVALTNLSGMEFPFASHDESELRARHARRWRNWWASISDHASERPNSPTTSHHLRVFEDGATLNDIQSSFLLRERALRALGALGGASAVPLVTGAIAPYLSRAPSGTEEKLMVQAGTRALGRLRTHEARSLLIRLLGHPYWARYAADALGDIGGTEAAGALIAAYPDYAMTLEHKVPPKIPADDRPGFEAVDRMYETPYAIALALSRFTFPSEMDRRKLRGITPLLVANMAGDFDGAMLYEEQAYQNVTAYLLECAGVRREVCEIAYEALKQASPARSGSRFSTKQHDQLLALARRGPGGTSFAAEWLAALCRGRENTPRLLPLLEHDNGWVRINAAKTLMFIGDRSAAAPIAALLSASKTEAEHGYFGSFLFEAPKWGQDEYNAPSPCWREAFTRALGTLGDARQVRLLVKLLNDERNVLEVRHAAAQSLAMIGGPDALAALGTAASRHPFHSIRLLARESLWKRDIDWAPSARSTPHSGSDHSTPTGDAAERPEAIVFIKGSNDMPNDFQIDIWRQTYSTTDSGPTYRLGENLFLLKPATSNGKVSALTRFTDGYVADCEVSWDGTRVVFARRTAETPWWHIHELELRTGSLKQLTDGPYHDVQPAYLPDGRIVFSSSRTGLRDEYHGYPATGLTVMNPDGTGLHCIGFNLGRDNEPAVMPDGRIVFSRLDLFYSRLKTEITVQTMRPDGTMNRTIYGPEKRDLWRNITRLSGERGWGEAPPRHRVLRLTQPQALDNQRVVVATTGGATIIGPGPLNERILPRHNDMAVTSPFPLDKRRLLCAATVRTPKRSEVDLGLYTMDLATGVLTPLYNDPASADFEARPIMRRPLPHTLPPAEPSNSFTAKLMCGSAMTTRDSLTRERAKLVRIIEGQPVTSRHHTHTSTEGEAWKNHVGTHARVLGTVPLAPDGSFHVEIPADRLVHCQILDSDRRVVGNQLVWMYARPGETRSCVGCHEMPDTAGISRAPGLPVGATYPPIKCLPTGKEFSYRAKAWQKGRLSSETEARTRTVNAVNLPGRN